MTNIGQGQQGIPASLYHNSAYQYGKRAADAEPEANAVADHALLYGYGLPYTYAAQAHAYNAAYRTHGKRSADADPTLLYGASGYGLPHPAGAYDANAYGATNIGQGQGQGQQQGVSVFPQFPLSYTAYFN